MSSSRGKGIDFSYGADFSSFPTTNPEIGADDEHNIEEGGGQESQHSNPTSTARKPPIKSDIFEKHFNKVSTGEKTFQATCNYCGKGFKWKVGGGYGTLRNHLVTKHPTETGISRSQTQITGYETSPNPTSLFRYSDEKNREELAKLVSVEHLAFNFGEKLNFVTYCQNALNPAAKRVPRTTLTRTIKKLYKKGKAEFQNFFFNFKGRVSLCCDIWSDHWQQHHYLGITCHWIDDAWCIQKRLLAYRVFDESHNAQNLWRMINMILEEYNLVQKIFSISVDNASANTVAINELENICRPSIGGKFFHVRCTCHIINLCVQDGIKSLDHFISPIRTAISFLWSRPNLRKDWVRFCKINKMRPKNFPKDVPTRWNSTYELLNESFPYKDLLCTFFSSIQNNIILLPQQWSVCEKILRLLETFNNATYNLSGVYYPTAHLLVMDCVNISCVFDEYVQDRELSPCVLSMASKWLKYFIEIPRVNLVATVFNPNIKIEGLQNLLYLYYENMQQFYNNPINIPEYITYTIIDIKKIIQDLINEYSDRIGASSSSAQAHIPIIDTTKYSKADLLILQRQKRPRGGMSTSNMEFDTYLMTSFELGEHAATSFPILQWWKDHTEQFPILAAIAKEVLASPVSTVAVEQAFSTGGIF